MKSRQTVFVMMSGGVDSSVAAALLKRRGFDVVGVFMKNWHDATGKFYCPWEEDEKSARQTADVIGIPFYTLDFEKAYRARVVNYMLKGYRRGITPNPDVMCNREIKFGLFFERAMKMGADYVASGHYVRRGYRGKPIANSGKPAGRLNPIGYTLLAARDRKKDQSYFLWTLTQKHLQRCLFPIGDYTKPEVRALARKFRLPNAERKDSQGICFIGEIDVADFLRTHIAKKIGPIVTATDETIGMHDGAWFYTIGQRHGLGIGGGIPYYVVKKDVARNQLVVAAGRSNDKLYSNTLTVHDINWISGTAPRLPLRCRARIRYQQPLTPCSVSHFGSSKTEVKVKFNEPQFAVTPGQSIVFYRGHEMLGGAIIAFAPESE